MEKLLLYLSEIAKSLSAMFFLFAFLGASSQTCDVSLRNDSLIDSKNLIVDVYVKATSGNFYYGQGQYKIYYDSAIRKGGTISGTILAGNCDLSNTAQKPTGVLTGGTANPYFRMATATVPANQAACSVISSNGPGTKICRVQLTNTVDFASNAANLTLTFTAPNQVKIWYMNALNLLVEITSPSLVLDNSNLSNPTLNGTITAYNVTGTGPSPSNVGLDGSQSGGLNYQLYKNDVKQGAAIDGTGSAISFGSQSTGTYKVKGHRKSTYLYSDMDGDAVLSPAWTGSVNTDWNNAANWSDGIPLSTSNEIIPAPVPNFPHVNLSIATPAVVNNLIINSGASLTIDQDKALTVSGTLTNNAGNSGLVIESGGSLLHNTSGVPATIKRLVTGSTDLTAMMFHFVSVPLETTCSPTTSLFTGSYLFKYDEDSNAWISMGSSTTTLLDVSRGYMMYYPGGASTTLAFPGPMNSGSFTALTTNTGEGYNLVPNPYPSAIDWINGNWVKTNLDDAIYTWPAGAGASSGNYISYVSGVGTNGGTQYIPLGQSFLVHANGNPLLSMDNSVRVHNTQYSVNF